MLQQGKEMPHYGRAGIIALALALAIIIGTAVYKAPSIGGGMIARMFPSTGNLLESPHYHPLWCPGSHWYDCRRKA